MRISHACASQGVDCLQQGDWAAQYTMAKVKTRIGLKTKWWRTCGKNTNLATLFFIANEEMPDWFSGCPMRSASSVTQASFKVKQFGNAVGIDHEDFLGL